MRVVLKTCFDGNPHEMLRAARHFMVHGRPPLDLGQCYRRVLKTRPRRPWWQSVLNRLNDLDTNKANEVFDVDSIIGLRAAWAAVSRGETVLLAEDRKVFGRVSPVISNRSGE